MLDWVKHCTNSTMKEANEAHTSIHHFHTMNLLVTQCF